MAMQVSRSESAKENTLLQDESPVDETNLIESRFECPICIGWLNEPVLTSCGHKFCKNCITSWLKKPNSTCPIDNKRLTFEDDIFPDNFTRREILQIRKLCPNSNFGCIVNLSPIEMDDHLMVCQFKKNDNFTCIFQNNGCQFVGKNQQALDEHLQKELVLHLKLINDIVKLNNSTIKVLEANTQVWDAPNKQNDPNTSTSSETSATNDNLIKSLFERIVILEQMNREQNSKIENLTHQLMAQKIAPENDPKLCGGTIVWKITEFQEKLTQMRKFDKIFYSTEGYTSTTGYKFCARLNVLKRHKEFISLHMHLMQSPNDYHLDWPIQGQIKFVLINVQDHRKSRHDFMATKPDILAFHRPLKPICPRGFGFLEYVSINDLLNNNFVVNDTLVIKVQMNLAQ